MKKAAADTNTVVYLVIRKTGKNKWYVNILCTGRLAAATM